MSPASTSTPILEPDPGSATQESSRVPIPPSQLCDNTISTPVGNERPPIHQKFEVLEHSSGNYDQGPLPSRSRGQSEDIEEQHTQGSPDSSADAGDRECPRSTTGITNAKRIDCAEDLMQSIRSRVLKAWETPTLRNLEVVSLYIRCNVREFMDSQFAGSNKNLGRVVTLSGTATHGQATTCSEYIYSNWPLRGLWLLDILQGTFDGAEITAEGCNSDLEINQIVITITSFIRVGFFGSKEAAIDVVQLLMWFGAAFQVSSSDQLHYSKSKLSFLSTGRLDFLVCYDQSTVDEESCWFSLFNNPVIAQGFPVPERNNSERGLELPIELMATLGGGRHAIDFKGGLVIKGYSIAFLPVKQYEDTIQWHMVSNRDGTRLRYSDLSMHRALQNEVDFESIKTKRAILGWSRVAQTLLGTAGLNYKDIDWSEANEAGRSTRLAGGGLGLQSNIIGQLNFALGPKDGRLLLSQNGPLLKIIERAEKTPVVLYDHGERRAWLVPAHEVILHVIHTRCCLNLYKLDRSKIKNLYSDETARISDQAATRVVIANQDQQLYESTSLGEKPYYVRDAVVDIWSLLERMMERDAVITSAPGVPVRGTMRDKLYGWEFRALVEDKSSFRQKEQVLEKSNGGWVDLVNDTDTIVLFGNGFEEVIKPVRGACSAWKSLPKGRDYLAVGCPMLETLYNEAGSRKTRSYLTSRHLQWHRGSTLFETCEEISSCACDRLQQLVYDSRTTFRRVKPPDELPEDGCVIFGRAYHPMIPARDSYEKKRTIYSIANRPLPEAKPPRSPTHSPTSSVEYDPVTDRMPDGNDLSSVFVRSSSSSADSASERKFRILPFKTRRKVGDKDACGRDSLSGRQKKHSLRKRRQQKRSLSREGRRDTHEDSSSQFALTTYTKLLRNTWSNLENENNNEVASFPPDNKDLLGQAPEYHRGKAMVDKQIHWQSHPTLKHDSEAGEGVDTWHA